MGLRQRYRLDELTIVHTRTSQRQAAAPATEKKEIEVTERSKWHVMGAGAEKDRQQGLDLFVLSVTSCQHGVEVQITQHVDHLQAREQRREDNRPPAPLKEEGGMNSTSGPSRSSLYCLW